MSVDSTAGSYVLFQLATIRLSSVVLCIIAIRFDWPDCL